MSYALLLERSREQHGLSQPAAWMTARCSPPQVPGPEAHERGTGAAVVPALRSILSLPSRPGASSIPNGSVFLPSVAMCGLSNSKQTRGTDYGTKKAREVKR